MTPDDHFDATELVEFTGQGVRGTARRLRIDPALLYRRLTATQADRFSCRLGVHPASVFGEDWWPEPDFDDPEYGEEPLGEDWEWDVALFLYDRKRHLGLAT